jgi:hypothetical protein
MAIEGTVVGYVVVVHHPRRGEMERRCPTVEDVDAVAEWVRRGQGGLEYFTLIESGGALERDCGFSRSTPPRSIVFRTNPCPVSGSSFGSVFFLARFYKYCYDFDHEI